MYQLLITKYAQKQLEKIPEREYKKIVVLIRSLAANPRPFGYIKLKGEDAYRIRSGNYRVIYEIKDKMMVVSVIEVGNRKDVY